MTDQTPTPSPDTASTTILVVDDVAANRHVLSETLEPEGWEVLVAPDGQKALEVARRGKPDLVLLDVMMPGINGFETCRRLKQDPTTQHIPVLFISARDEIDAMTEGFDAGGVDYITKPFRTEEVLIRVRTHLNNHRLNQLVLEKNRELEATNQRLQEEINRRKKAEDSFQTVEGQLSLISEMEAQRWGIPGLIGCSQIMTRILSDIRKLQPLASTPVLIIGESGTGKELIARALHFGSPRAKGPFLPVNCSAVPNDLAESLFFGHAKGAFSGASESKAGYFQNAAGGTLFLDEIGDMPMAIQAKLLRVLETGRILPLGAAQEKEVDVRILAATNADLEAEIEAGRFRQDLYYRLARFITEVPPLRERKEDIGPLVTHFLDLIAREMGMTNPGISQEAVNALAHHDFPGNARELKNLIERALIDSGGNQVESIHLRSILPPEPPANTGQDASSPTESAAPDDQATRILEFARKHDTINNAQCRDLLGINMHQAWYLLRKLHRNGRLVQDNTKRWARYRLP